MDDYTRGASWLDEEAERRMGDPDQVDPPSQPLRNARRFAGAEYHHQERRLLVHQGGMFFGWDGTCWPAIDDAELRSRLYRWFDAKTYLKEAKGAVEPEPFAPNRYKVADLLDALRAENHIALTVTTPSWVAGRGPHVALAADELIACGNGLVHWPTRTLHPHTPTYYAHHSVAFGFDAQAPEPGRWYGFLRELWGDDTESIETLQELFGYLVSGDTRLQKMFLTVGPRRSGKGTIARVMRAMLGAHNVAGPTLASIATNFGMPPLIGKPVAIIADARIKASDTSVVTERLLSISGEDTLTVDRKYREPWTGQLPARIVVLSNELPRLSDSSGALASRFIVLSMTKSFYGSENPDLTSELTTELPGIFNWALDGLERLRQRGRFIQPASSTEAIREMEDLGSPIGAFIRDECEVAPGFSVARDQLYDAWKQWCVAHGRRQTAIETFGRDLRAAVPGLRTSRPRDGDGMRYRAYEGIGLVHVGPWTRTMYSQQSNGVSSTDNNAVVHGPAWTGRRDSAENNGVDRGPSRTTHDDAEIF